MLQFNFSFFHIEGNLHEFHNLSSSISLRGVELKRVVVVYSCFSIYGFILKRVVLQEILLINFTSNRAFKVKIELIFMTLQLQEAAYSQNLNVGYD